MAEPELYSGRYELLRHLARGGMAEVYLARDHLLDRPVAVKVLFAEYARDEAFVERFRREAKAAANLNHPNIVAVYDWGEENETYYIVMEYVEGQSLRDLIHDEGTLLPERAAEISADVAAALGYAHRHGVVHRDVKPGNILITPQGQVKVTDFGIARAGAGDHHLTRTGMVMGTATYFSPEQAQGSDVDPRSDVYSLGIVTYEMVAGEPPFAGDDPVSIAYQHVREEPMPPGIKNPDVPIDMERIILAALNKAPGDRYQSADELRDDLVAFAKGQPVASKPVTAVLHDADATTVTERAEATSVQEMAPGPAPEPRPIPTRRRRPSAIWVTLILILALIAGLAVLAVNLLSSEGETVEVPSVVGLELEEARTELEELGFEVETEFVENEEVPENQVISQDPEDGTQAEEGSAVTLTVSEGVGTIPLPDVSELPADEARDELENAGFSNIEARDEFSDEVDEGNVVRTEPRAGDQVEPDATIVMFVSSGVQPVEVPDVVREDQAIASNILGRAEFDVAIEEEPSDDVPSGQVIRTEPPAGELAPKGSTVTMIVSSGPEPVVVPDVITDSPGEARDKIEERGLVANEETTTSCDLSEEGTVVDQNPPPESEVDEGTTVTFFTCEFSGGGDGGGGNGGGGGGD